MHLTLVQTVPVATKMCCGGTFYS